MTDPAEKRVRALVLDDPPVRTIFERAPQIGVEDSGTPTGSTTTAALRYAPCGYDDLFAMVVRPHPRQVPRHVYESKAARWKDTGRS